MDDLRHIMKQRAELERDQREECAHDIDDNRCLNCGKDFAEDQIDAAEYRMGER